MPVFDGQIEAALAALPSDARERAERELAALGARAEREQASSEQLALATALVIALAAAKSARDAAARDEAEANA